MSPLKKQFYARLSHLAAGREARGKIGYALRAAFPDGRSQERPPISSRNPGGESKMRKFLLMLACLVPLAAPALADEAALLAEAREIPKTMMPRMLEVLENEIAKNGHANAISVCRDKAPQMAKALSEKTGWAIRRVSMKNRNPAAVPDAWEQSVLDEFEKRLAAGENPAGIDKSGVVTVNGQKTFRYMKALPTGGVCLDCHGPANKLAPGVAERVRELYPEDKATGYQLKQLRGAITIRKAL